MATIVIVEDEEELRDNLQDLLEFKDYTVIPLSRAEELISQLDTLSFDVILMDYQLPGMNGLDAIRKVKEKGFETPIALVTASHQRDTLDEADKVGAHRVIIKPYSHDEIFSAIEEMLQ
jgi:CheY-like chemotaxis protein